MKKLIFIFSILILALTSCHKDSDFDTEEEVTTTVTPTIDEAKLGFIYGLVTDRAGNPIKGAQVNIYDKSTGTDQNGVFSTPGLLSPVGSLVKVSAEGYFEGSDLIYSTTDKGYSQIVLIKKDNAKQFNAGSGGQIDIDGGGSITFPENVIVDNNGENYGGEVKIYAKRIATDDPNFHLMMPGGLIASDSEGRTVVLGSMGMLAVEMYDSSGNPVQIKEGNTAKTTFPIAPDMRSIASETIETWSYDENKGLWIEEGVATKVGDEYVAEIPHFSFWNCDAPFPLVKMKGRVLGADGEPLNNISIQVNAEGFGIGYAFSPDGSFCGLIPKNAEFTLIITYAGCDGAVYSGVYGPYENDVDLGDIQVEEALQNISGTVFCLEESLADAYLMVTMDESVFIYYTEGGIYDIDLCPSGTYTIRAVDAVTGKASDVLTVTENENLTYDFQVCDEDCNLSLVITDNEEDACDESDVLITAEVTGGSGNYSYLWESGETTPTIGYKGAIQYCVDVLDIDTDCSQSFCKTVSFQDSIGLEGNAVFYLGCNSDDTGNILLSVYSGELPMTASVVGVNDIVEITEYGKEYDMGTFSNNEEHKVEITDAKGCFTSLDAILRETSGNAAYIYTEQESNNICSGDDLSLSAYYNDPALIESYVWSDGSAGENIIVNQPGTYCVTITLTNGCTAEGCIDILEFEFDESKLQQSCWDGNFTFWYQDPVEVTASNYKFVDVINPENPDYSTVTIGPYGGSCSASYDHYFVDNSALGNFQVNNTTCADCEDGYVTFTNESESIFCEDCQFNVVTIYKISDIESGTYLSYHIQNEQQNLASGDYVLIGMMDDNLQDDRKGCVVVRQAFTIE